MVLVAFGTRIFRTSPNNNHKIKESEHMKKLLALALLAAGFVAVQAADAIFRVDVNGVKDKVTFTIHQDDEMKGAPQGWVKQNKECTITYGAVKKIGSTEWKDYEISFTPKTSGTVNISVGGQWAKTPDTRAWLLVNKVEMNDKLYPNGDFTKTYKTKDGRVIPNGFWIHGKAKYLPTAGEKGTPAVLVNHDNRLTFNLKVEAGKKYEFEFEVKAATPDQVK